MPLPNLHRPPAELKSSVALASMHADREAGEVIDSLPRYLPEIKETPSGMNQFLIEQDDIQLDPSQLEAVESLSLEQFGVLIGAAGTGKTTIAKELVNRIIEQTFNQVNMKTYWGKGKPVDDESYTESETGFVPAIVIACPTGKASQQNKRNFPPSWWPNIMTIHRMLGFYPEFFESVNDQGFPCTKRRFVPSYDEQNKMPWETYFFDESGMFDAARLWQQFRAACKPNARIFLIGDIQQLPPTHGPGALGFAMAKWPVKELTTIHRQKGTRGSIVDNAHRVLRGQPTICDSLELAPKELAGKLSFESEKQTLATLRWLLANDDWEFAKVKIPSSVVDAAKGIHQALLTMCLKDKDLYRPFRDSVIVPTNGHNAEAPGFQLGQAPMNDRLVKSLNPNPRCYIDAGRIKQTFALGDKVMATVNDYETGVTNGMTGVVESITPNGNYTSHMKSYGFPDEVAQRYADDPDELASMEEHILDDLNAFIMLDDEDKRDGGAASHIVTVKFGQGESAFEVPFQTKGQVASLMLAYIVTCHKMQGSEADNIWTILHPSTPRPLTREWLYTALTRASRRQILLYNARAEAIALSKQVVKGVTLEQKLKNFERKPEILRTFPEPRKYQIKEIES